MRHRTATFLTLALTAPLFLVGCVPTVCTLVGCPSQVSVVATSSSSFEAGRYTATVFANDREFTQEVVVSGNPGEVAGDERCNETFCFTFYASSAGLSVGVNSRSTDVLFDSVRVEFEFEGNPLGSVKQALVYENEYPNGEDCNACPTSLIELKID